MAPTSFSGCFVVGGTLASRTRACWTPFRRCADWIPTENVRGFSSTGRLGKRSALLGTEPLNQVFRNSMSATSLASRLLDEVFWCPAAASSILPLGRQFSASAAPPAVAARTYAENVTEFPEKFDVCIIGGGPAGFAAAMRAVDYKKRVCLIERRELGGHALFHGAMSSKMLWNFSRETRLVKESVPFFNVELRDIQQRVWRAQMQKVNLMREQLAHTGYVTFVHGKAKFNSPHSVIASCSDEEYENSPDGSKSWSFSAENLMQKEMLDELDSVDRVPVTQSTIVGSEQLSDVFVHSTAAPTVKSTPTFVRVGNRKTLEIRADHFVISTGSKPRLPNPSLAVVDGQTIMTSDHINHMHEFPKSIAIVGAGVIGCEFATILSNFGRTQVHLFNERKSRLLPTEDEDVVNMITENLQKLGVFVHSNCELVKMGVERDDTTDPAAIDKLNKHCKNKYDCNDEDAEATDNRIRCWFRQLDSASGSKGKDGPAKSGSTDQQQQQPLADCKEIIVDKALITIGREPQTSNLDLDKAGVNLDPKGSIISNDQCQSSQPHIFVAGDSSAHIGLVSVGEMEGRHAIEYMFRPKDQVGGSAVDESIQTPFSYQNVSTIMFLEPEIACIGMNEMEARRRNVPYIAGKYSFDLVNRSIISSGYRPQHGFVKLLVSNDKDMRLLGMRAVGMEASSLIETASFFILEKRSIRDLHKILHPHPAISEAVQECVRMLLGDSIYKPIPSQSYMHITKFDGVKPSSESSTNSAPQKPRSEPENVVQSPHQTLKPASASTRTVETAVDAENRKKTNVSVPTYLH